MKSQQLRPERGTAIGRAAHDGQISEIADTLQGNLDKVVQHGKRADAIVKNMLTDAGDRSLILILSDINMPGMSGQRAYRSRYGAS